MHNQKMQFITNVVRKPKAFYSCMKDTARQFALNDLLREFSGTGSDKGMPGHNYARVYHGLLGKRRNDLAAFCEIGLLRSKLHGGKNGEGSDEVHEKSFSLSVWGSYFPNANIVGFDLKQFKEPADERITIIQGDQKERGDLQKIADAHSQYDVIIDDGLHASEHQQVTFSFLFRHLKSDGIFFIEDLWKQLPKYEKPEIPKTRDLLRELQQNKTWSSPVATPEEKAYIESNVKEIQFFDSMKYFEPQDPILKNDNLVAIFKK